MLNLPRGLHQVRSGLSTSYRSRLAYGFLDLLILENRERAPQIQ